MAKKTVNASDKQDTDLLALARQVAMLVGVAGEGENARAVHDVAMTLATHASDELRRSLAAELEKSRFIPADLALTIARDSAEISGPFLAKAKCLTNELLICILEQHPDAAVSVAARDNLKEPVSFHISQNGSEVAVTTLMLNKTAEISERVCSSAVDRFPESLALVNAMARRDDLPLVILDLIMAKASYVYRQLLMNRYNLSEDHASWLAGESRRAAFNVVLSKARERELQTYFKSLNGRGMLKPADLLDLLKERNVPGFLVALQTLSGARLDEVRASFTSVNMGEMKAHFASAGVPAVMQDYYLEELAKFG